MTEREGRLGHYISDPKRKRKIFKPVPMHITTIIPARYASKRFPGKPLVPIAGIPMLERVWRIAGAAKGVDAVLVATDDERIQEAARAFGATVVMTSPDCRDGTERVAQAVQHLSTPPDAVINLQGDAVLTPPWVISALADALRQGAGIVTPAVRCSPAQLAELQQAKQAAPASGTLVVCDRQMDALYFSKTIIPFVRPDSPPPPVWRHIGLYGYTVAALREWVQLEPGPLEQAEQLEQLRILENGGKIRVVPVDYRGRTHWSVDSPADVPLAEAIIAREGELC